MKKIIYFILFLNNFCNNIQKLNLFKNIDQDFFHNKYELIALIIYKYKIIYYTFNQNLTDFYDYKCDDISRGVFKLLKYLYFSSIDFSYRILSSFIKFL